MPESDNTHTFIPFAEQAPKRKRAEAVCTLCHSKKIKCDIQARTQRGLTRCSNCETTHRECELRHSQRGKRKRSPDHARQASTATSTLGTSEAAPATDFGLTSSAPNNESLLAAPSNPAGPTTNPGSHSPPGTRDDGFLSRQQFSPLTSMSGVGTHRSHGSDLDAGYLHVYGPENQLDADMQEMQAHFMPSGEVVHEGMIDSSLQSTFVETYWEYCYCFCPVLDRSTVLDEMARSPMLTNAVALAASHVQPPLLPHDGPEKYYNRARRLFYEDHEPDALTTLKALSLFYWWAPRPPSTIHRHTSWWWQSVIIRHAQQMGIHREPPPESPLCAQLDLSSRRRIWWTAFARERLTGLCQSKPCIIDQEDCTISEVQLSDFPNDPQSQRKGLIFIHWVRLCGIIGRMAKKSSTAGGPSFHVDAHSELSNWIHALPQEIKLRLDSDSATAFDRDVYQLHLPYLTAVIILHLRRSAHDLPQALPPAILAASCTAKVLRKILARGNARFMMAITCWYCGTAFIALLQGSRISQFANEADDGIKVLISMVEQLQKMWPSANVIRQGFDRLRQNVPTNGGGTVQPGNIDGSSTQQGSANITTIGPGSSGAAPEALSSTDRHLDWTGLLPFADPSTDKIAKCLLHNKESGNVTRGMPSPANTFFYENVMNEYNDFLDPFFTDFSIDATDFSHLQV